MQTTQEQSAPRTELQEALSRAEWLEKKLKLSKESQALLVDQLTDQEFMTENALRRMDRLAKRGSIDFKIFIMKSKSLNPNPKITMTINNHIYHLHIYKANIEKYMSR